MSSLVGSVIGSAIQSLTVLVYIKVILLDENKKIINRRDIILFMLLCVPTIILYNGNYSAINPINFFIFIILGLIFIYKFSFSKSFLFAGLYMGILFLSDLVISFVFVWVSSIKTIRTNFFYITITNSLVGLLDIIILYINNFKKKLISIIQYNSDKKCVELVAFISLLILELSICVYVLFENYFFSKTFLSGILGIVIFLILSIIFLKEKYDKNILTIKYDQLFEYVQTFEEWMDNENVNIHESKNQLAALRDMIKNNKKAVQYIDNIIKDELDLESKNIQKLRNIPKGGLKGLLYYKIIFSEKNNIVLYVDISDKVTNKLTKLTIEENKMLCRLVGIFFDNAIEAAKESEKRIISCEVYTNNKNIIITITNTYNGKLELDKISEKGYSTKGKNRGKGLYLANKIAKKSDVFFLDKRIINDFYIQKITIKKT